MVMKDPFVRVAKFMRTNYGTIKFVECNCNTSFVIRQGDSPSGRHIICHARAHGTAFRDNK